MKIKVIRPSISTLWSRPRQLVSGLSLWRPRFVPGSVHVEFVVDKVTLRIFLQALQFSLFNIIPLWFCNTHVPSGGWTIGPLVATVQKCSLTPLTWTWHKQQLHWAESIMRNSGSQEISCLLWNQKVHYHIHMISPLVPVLSQMNPFHILQSCSPKIHYNIVLQFMPRFSKRSLSFWLSNQNSVYISSHLPKCATVPTQLILLELIILIFWLIVQNAWLLLPSATFWTNKLHLCQCWKFGRLLTKRNIHTTLTTWIQMFKI
jgi:hypothetical protein